MLLSVYEQGDLKEDEWILYHVVLSHLAGRRGKKGATVRFGRQRRPPGHRLPNQSTMPHIQPSPMPPQPDPPAEGRGDVIRKEKPQLDGSRGQTFGTKMEKKWKINSLGAGHP